MTEAIDVALAELFDEIDRALTEAETFPDAIGVIVAPWRRLLVDHDFAFGLSTGGNRRRRRRQRRPPAPTSASCWSSGKPQSPTSTSSLEIRRR
jgi:hypothetical protein